MRIGQHRETALPTDPWVFEREGDTLASRTANQYQGATSNIQVASLIYLAFILLVITFITNLAAQLIVKRFEYRAAGGD